MPWELEELERTWLLEAEAQASSPFYHFLLNREDIKFPDVPSNSRRDRGNKRGKRFFRKSFKKGEWMIHNIIITMRNGIHILSMCFVLENVSLVPFYLDQFSRTPLKLGIFILMVDEAWSFWLTSYIKSSFSVSFHSWFKNFIMLHFKFKGTYKFHHENIMKPV